MADLQRRRCKRCQAGVEHEWTHGTLGGYRYHGCRCSECKQFMREQSVSRYWSDRDRQLELKRHQRERNIDVHRERERQKKFKPETAATAKRRKNKLSRVPVARCRKWMPHEQALVLRDDLSVLELAYMLQRSASSVQAQRCWLRNADAIRERNIRWRQENYGWYMEQRRAKEGITKRGTRTACKRGHPYDESNTYRDRKGQRYCKTCRKKPPAPPRPVLTHCPQGHEYSEENTHVVGGVYKRCRTCDRDRHNARYVPNPKAPVTHCPQDHEYTVENTYRNKQGSRLCRICRLDSKRRYNQRMREQAA